MTQKTSDWYNGNHPAAEAVGETKPVQPGTERQEAANTLQVDNGWASMKPLVSGIKIQDATNTLQGNHVAKLHRWNALRESPQRSLFDLLQYALQDPKNALPGGAFGFSARDTRLVDWFTNGGYRSGQLEVDKAFLAGGLYPKLRSYYEQKLKAGELSEAWVNNIFPNDTVNIRAAAETWLGNYEQAYQRIDAEKFYNRDNKIQVAASTQVQVLPDFVALLKEDKALSTAWFAFKKGRLRNRKKFESLDGIVSNIQTLINNGKYGEATFLLSIAAEQAEHIGKDMPFVKKFTDVLLAALNRFAAAPSRLEYPNPATRETLGELKAFLDKNFPVEGEENLVAACPGWRLLTPEKQDELIAKNRTLHEVFGQYSKNTETRNALYDTTYERLNKGMAPRGWPVMSAVLATRILHTLPELYLREVTSRIRNEHGYVFRQNHLDESGEIPAADDTLAKKKPHAVLFFDFVKSMENIARGQPYVSNMRRYDMMMRLLRFEREGVLTHDQLSTISLDAFEALVMEKDHGPLGYQKHADAVAAGKAIALDGYEDVDPTRDGQLKDFAAMQDLVRDVPAELVDYPDQTVDFHLRHALKHKSFMSSIVEHLSTLSRENSTDGIKASYMGAMLMLMEQYLGYQPDEQARRQSVLWPYVHVGLAAGVEADHAKLALEGLMHQLASAKMDVTGRFADWLTDSIKAIYDEKGGFQKMHYRHYEIGAAAIEKACERAGPGAVIPPKPKVPWYSEGKGNRTTIAAALDQLKGDKPMTFLEARQNGDVVKRILGGQEEGVRLRTNGAFTMRVGEKKDDGTRDVVMSGTGKARLG